MTISGAGSVQRASCVDECESAPCRSLLEDEVVSLFEQLRTPVLRYLISSNVTASDGEEIVQEVFLLLFEHLRAGKSRSNLPGWIFRTAHNLALKHHERARRRAQRFDDGHWNVEGLEDESDRADARFEASERQDNLMAVVRALPERDQRCLHLRAEGLSYRAIAEVLDISLGAVANSLQRSIARLTRAERR